MRSMLMDRTDEAGVAESLEFKKSPENLSSQHSPRDEGVNHRADGVVNEEVSVDGVVDTSIDKLYENVCDMQSSDQSPSRQSFGSDGEESQIDSELGHLAGEEMREIEIMEEDEMGKQEDDAYRSSSSMRESSSRDKPLDNIQSASSKLTSSGRSKKDSLEPLVSEASQNTTPNDKSTPERPPSSRNLKKPNASIKLTKKHRNSPLVRSKVPNGTKDSSDSDLSNIDLGRYLLKQARDLISTGENPKKALDLALRAAKSFEICANGKPSLELVMSLYVTAAIYCSIGQYSEAITILGRSIEIPVIEEGLEHALAKFAGYMQLGDTYAMVGQLENSTKCYTTGMEIQKQALGENDPRVGETCRYLAEAYVQALQFDEAEKLCQMALDIHKENNSPASLEEAADRRLMGLICETKGNYEAALEHLVLASMAMVASSHERGVASVDCSIGDTYLSLSRYDEAALAYQKALTAFKTSKGENHPTVGSVFVRLADLYNRTGKLREAKSYCENALRIYEKAAPGIPPEEIASGLTNVSAIYESMDELEEAINLLQKALKIYNDAPGQQSTIAGIEAQIGVMYYMLGSYSESYNFLKNGISKLRASGEKKSKYFGIALNQMGLSCVQCYAINEAAELFKEAKSILEQECGPFHPDTVGVYSNLAGTYDAMGRLDDAIELLKYIVRLREEKLGTANPDVDNEKRRLAELLKEAGRVGGRKGRSLENLLDANSHNNEDALTIS